MRITFVSNYINHHQIPFCRAMISNLSEGDKFTFIQTQEMEDDRKKMGWDKEIPDFVRLSYTSEEEKKACRELIFESEVVIFGGCEDESYIAPRLEALREGSADDKKYLTFRYSERVYKEGQWKFVTPKGLRKKYLDHTRYNSLPVYLLCSGGYVASDFSLFGAYKEKKYKWGYFPEVRSYDIDSLLEAKGYGHVNILWSGRMLDWKHPELAIETALYLRDKGHEYQMEIIGTGSLESYIKEIIQKKDLVDKVKVLGSLPQESVREHMEKANIFLFTSDQNEGWGAVVNEAMNSACAVIGCEEAGCVPYMIDNTTGFIYKSGEKYVLFEECEKMVSDQEYTFNKGIAAYHRIQNEWNGRVAAQRLVELIEAIGNNRPISLLTGPCSPA